MALPMVPLSEAGLMLDAPFHNSFRHAPNATDAPKLLAAAPIIAVSEELDRQLGELRLVAPTSDATAALTLYGDKLSAAIQRARQIELFISAEQAALILGRSVSMITYLCRTGALNAKKVGGTWQIDRLELERMQHQERADERTRARVGS